MRPRFFVSLPDPGSRTVVPGLVVELADSDARHGRTVLRSRSGDPCELVFSDPSVLADAVFEEVGRRVSARVTAVRVADVRRVRLLLAQALPQPRKVDEVIEKGTEVGFDSFLVMPSAASPAIPHQKLEARSARWRTIAGEAAKQSRQPAVPDVRTASSLAAALELTQAERWSSVVLTPDVPDHLADVLAAEARGTGEMLGGPEGGGDAGGGAVAGPVGRWALWVGPEGGWSTEELEVLQTAGARTAGLGSRILRTETAGPVAGALARYALSDW
ncbi:MAG: RsmE family RNA methyltransferase [Thermoleophilia bacterium]